MIQDLQKDSIKKILIFQQRQIGDLVLATPSIELVAKQFPNAEIHVFTEKKCVPILLHNPYISKILVLDKSKLTTLWKSIKFYWSIAKQNYDMIIALQHLPRLRWILAFSHAKYKIGLKNRFYNRIFYTHVVPIKGNYAAEEKASILRILDIHWNKEAPTIYLTEKEHAEAKTILSSHNISQNTLFITLDPTHRRITRQYPLNSYAQLVDILAEQYQNIKILPIYGPGEENEIKELVESVKNKSALILPPNMLSLRQLAAIISYAKVHIGNCSAPRHIATAVSTPTFTILGSTGGIWRYPSALHKDISAGLNCQPCFKNICPRLDNKNACLVSLPPRWVADSIIAHIQTITRQKNDTTTFHIS
ncbi:MAG: glycosyltransferase family 9 protein [Desulfovibrionaceae bacterium]